MLIKPIVSSLFLGMSLLLPTPGFSETPIEDASARLVVTLVEYRAEISPSPDASPSEILAQLRELKVTPVRTIRLPTLSDCTAAFRAGDRIGIPQESSDREDELVFVEVGTILQLTAKRTGESVLMEFDYTTSRLTNNDDAGANPHVKESTVQATYSFQLGKPVLVGGLTADDGFYLVATVTEPTSKSATND